MPTGDLDERNTDDKKRGVRKFSRRKPGDEPEKPARTSWWKTLHLDRPPALYGGLMILTAIPAVSFHDLISPHLGLSRLETVGLLAAVILAAAMIDALTRYARQLQGPLGPLPLFLLLALAAGIVVEEVSWRAAVATVVLGLPAIHFAARLAEALSQGGTTWIERNWGGLGGALTGWRASSSIVHLAAALGFGTLLGIVLVVDTFVMNGHTGKERPEVAADAETEREPKPQPGDNRKTSDATAKSNPHEDVAAPDLGTVPDNRSKPKNQESGTNESSAETETIDDAVSKGAS
jgi:hypothetical protein